MLTYRSSAFDSVRSGAPDSGPRTPWSPVRAIRGRVARPLIDLEEPELAVSGTEGQVATISINQSINQSGILQWPKHGRSEGPPGFGGGGTGGGGVSLPQCESGVATLGKIMYILTQNVAFLCTFSQKLAAAAVKNVPSKHNWCLEA